MVNVILYDKGFGDVSKLRILRWGRLPLIIQTGLSAITNVLIKWRQRKSSDRKGKGNVVLTSVSDALTYGVLLILEKLPIPSPMLQSLLKVFKSASPYRFLYLPILSHGNHNIDSCPQFLLSLCPLAYSGASPFGSLWCGMPLSLRISKYKNFSRQSSPDLLALPYLNNN